ncbi:MAG: Fur family transcriptional regulator [Halanaerobiales bacterium]|nr:Fur family transcriptional regulator [Halanaerobiales bacterium]HPZ63440.1 Fur family transcriptional regulator [Halanaerobiales bacterium]HQD04677.1 Fur family transcriptional regulator [Halanaerobiales bacterium]
MGTKDKNLLERFTDMFRDNNYKLTAQRRDILDVLIDNSGKHFSAEELYAEVKKINPDIGLATVYRTLELMCQLGIAHQLDFDSNYKRYELNLEGGHHHHLICIDCGRIIEFNDQDLEDFEKRLEVDYEFRILDHHIKVYGQCKECQDKA